MTSRRHGLSSSEREELERTVELMDQAVARRAQGETIAHIAGELFPDETEQAGRSHVWALLQTHRRLLQEERRKRAR